MGRQVVRKEGRVPMCLKFSNDTSSNTNCCCLPARKWSPLWNDHRHQRQSWFYMSISQGGIGGREVGVWESSVRGGGGLEINTPACQRKMVFMDSASASLRHAADNGALWFPITIPLASDGCYLMDRPPFYCSIVALSSPSRRLVEHMAACRISLKQSLLDSTPRVLNYVSLPKKDTSRPHRVWKLPCFAKFTLLTVTKWLSLPASTPWMSLYDVTTQVSSHLHLPSLTFLMYWHNMTAVVCPR